MESEAPKVEAVEEEPAIQNVSNETVDLIR